MSEGGHSLQLCSPDNTQNMKETRHNATKTTVSTRTWHDCRALPRNTAVLKGCATILMTLNCSSIYSLLLRLKSSTSVHFGAFLVHLRYVLCFCFVRECCGPPSRHSIASQCLMFIVRSGRESNLLRSTPCFCTRVSDMIWRGATLLHKSSSSIKNYITSPIHLSPYNKV